MGFAANGMTASEIGAPCENLAIQPGWRRSVLIHIILVEPSWPRGEAERNEDHYFWAFSNWPSASLGYPCFSFRCAVRWSLARRPAAGSDEAALSDSQRATKGRAGT